MEDVTTITDLTKINNNDTDGLFHFSIDRGGTFTDIHCVLPNGKEVVGKLLSEDPMHYNDAPTEGIRRIIHEYNNTMTTTTTTTNEDDNDEQNEYPNNNKKKRKIENQDEERNNKIDPCCIGSIRMGTTVATNALLERCGTKTALLVTTGFHDILQIGNQSRPNIFDLTCSKPSVLYDITIPIHERVVLTKHYNKDETNNDNNKYPIKKGITGETVFIIHELDIEIILQQLIAIRDTHKIKAIAVCLMNSYVYPDHEIMIGNIAKEIGGFEYIALSHQICPMIKLVSRCHTTTASAYLTPQIIQYIQNFITGFTNTNDVSKKVQFMKSDGGLASIHDFGGHQAILSGPAGGVVGYAKTTRIKTKTNSINGNTTTANNRNSIMPVIGFDMGGTSTDVSRYDGSSGKQLEHVMETITAGVTIQAPQLDIHTVAAGGGSRLYYKHEMLHVGPESVGAHPGPVCYRKQQQHNNNNYQLAVTDANVVLGRIIPKYFPHIFGPNENQPLDVDGARIAFEEFITKIESTTSTSSSSSTPPTTANWTVETLAYGFLQVANEAMCRPIRNITQMKGYDITTHVLACFGGAGPQHACAMAKALGMSKVFVHKYSGILSAYGLSMADAVHEEQEPASEEIYNPQIGLSELGQQRLQHLARKAKDVLIQQGYNEDNIVIERYVNLRYDGTDNNIMILEEDMVGDNNFFQFDEAFREHYIREFGFVLQGRNILIEDFRVRAIIPGYTPPSTMLATDNNNVGCAALPDKSQPTATDTARAYFESGWQTVPVYKIEDLRPGHEITGPSIIVQPISTVVLEEFCTAFVTSNGDLEITILPSTPTPSSEDEDHHQSTSDEIIKEDPVHLSIFAHRFMGIAEQMGRTLQRTAISVNMKERLDFSCALFTREGGLVANAPHIPVHLGAMERAVRFQVEYWNSNGREGIQEGDVLVSNHPQLAGGSHLPDITVITPVFHESEILFFVASRGHHADIGGIAPGSMPPHSSKLEDEGAMIVAFKLVQSGQFQEEGITKILNSPGNLPGNSGTRNLSDNISDLRAQVAANNSGIKYLKELIQECGWRRVEAYMRFIQKNAETSVRRMLQEYAEKHRTTTAHAVDYMDDGSKIELTVTVDPETGSAVFDFTGTDPQVLGNHNAPPAVTYSAVIYSLRSLVAEDIPLNQGCLAPISFVIPENTLLNPSSDAAVVGGNVLTSQRVVDVVLRAFQACAASQGCMNNLTFGDKDFGYYETIAGGAGAGPTWEGQSGIHTHCTNTRITDPEILERRYPVILRQFAIRKGSGGRGLHNGGDGVIRELEPLRPLTMSILSERRTLHPYGMAGGEEGKCGRNSIIRKDGITVNIGGRCTTTLDIGERLRIETPGGGGYGTAVP